MMISPKRNMMKTLESSCGRRRWNDIGNLEEDGKIKVGGDLAEADKDGDIENDDSDNTIEGSLHSLLHIHDNTVGSVSQEQNAENLVDSLPDRYHYLRDLEYHQSQQPKRGDIVSY